jgi:hypothetical protein
MTILVLVAAVVIALAVTVRPAANTADTDTDTITTGDDDPRSRPDHRSRGPPPTGPTRVPGRRARRPPVPSALDPDPMSAQRETRRPVTPTPSKAPRPTSRSCRTEQGHTNTVVLPQHNRTTKAPTASQLSAINRNEHPESTGTAARNHRNAQPRCSKPTSSGPTPPSSRRMWPIQRTRVCWPRVWRRWPKPSRRSRPRAWPAEHHLGTAPA